MTSYSRPDSMSEEFVLADCGMVDVLVCFADYAGCGNGGAGSGIAVQGRQAGS